MTSVGQILRIERESQHREIAEIAEELCITKRYLRAIEEDDVQSLPGSFFYKSFVRQYAAILGLDENRLRPGVEALTATPEPVSLPSADPHYPDNASSTTNHDHFSTLPQESPVRELDPIVAAGNQSYFTERRVAVPIAGLVVVLLGCSGFYAWWNRAPQGPVASTSRGGQHSPAMTPTIPVEAAAPAVNVTTTTDPDGVNHVILNLSATEATWLSITTDGKQIFSGVLQPSQTKTVTTSVEAKLKVGNAGGIAVRWNGKEIGPIGPRGQVRTVLLSPEKVQILTPNETL